MGLIGRTIEQTRVWIDPNAPAPPNLNYKEVFPITVFDAIRKDINNENSKKLTEVLEDIYTELDSRQMKFPAKSANYLMTYAGVAGAVGSMLISKEIPWDPDKQSNDRIPTEKAIGDFIQKLGLIGDGGNIVDPESKKVRWSDIIGRPLMYEGLGINVDGFITQKGVTDAINSIKNAMQEHEAASIGAVNAAIQRLDDHRNDMDNPHHVTIGQLGAVSQESFDFHTQVEKNPHNITPDILGLGNVDNTSDMDKPISIATQEVIDEINKHIETLSGSITDLGFVTDIAYTQSTGKLVINFNNGNSKDLLIPIDGLVDEVEYDTNSKELIIHELNGESKRVDLSDLWVRYTGSIGSHITVLIDNEESLSPESDIDDVSDNDVINLWKYNILPPPPWFDGSDYNMSEITSDEVQKMWLDNILPEESGEIEGIDLSELSRDELQNMWLNGQVPSEVVGSIGNSMEELKNAGVKIIRAVINPYSITENEMSSDSVTTRIIKDRSVTSDKLAIGAVNSSIIENESITTDKLSSRAVNNSKLADRSVDGRTLFSSNVDNRVLAVTSSGSDPVWTRIIGSMIENYTIASININRDAIITSKIKDLAVTTSKLDNLSVTNEKIRNRSITLDKMDDNSVDGSKIVENVILKGNPSITDRPLANSDDNHLPDTRWVNDRIKSNVNENVNLDDRSVDGRVLFTSNTRHRALVVLRANSDPEWGLIDNDMMAVDSVDNKNIRENSITSDKIKDRSIRSSHLVIDSILNEHISESAISSESIFTSDNANMILAAIAENGHPVYTKLQRSMIENNAISTMQIEDGSVTPSKIESSDKSNMILGVGIKNSNPSWMKIMNSMINERAIDGRTLFTSGISNTILGVTKVGTDPVWTKINSEMLMDRSIKREHIGLGEIWQEHLQEKIIESRHIMDWSIQSNNIAPRAITGVELFTSPLPNRVLAVTSMPYSNPDWLQITTDMIEDKAISKEKMFQSDNPYRVLGATQAGVPPEYLMITHQFIVDDTIIPSKLVRNFTLLGTPELTTQPALDANNYQLANTKWVREVIGNMINEFHPDIFFDTLRSDVVQDMIKDAISDHSIDGTKLFLSEYEGPRVLGVTKKGEDPEYILIEEDLIVNGAITSHKIQRDVNLYGSPTVELRPSPFASDNKGGGNMIPDCQWVLDRIAEAGSIGGGSTVVGTHQEMSSSDVSYMWLTGKLPDGEYEDGSAYGLTEITDAELQDMWYNGVLPDSEDGSYEFDDGSVDNPSYGNITPCDDIKDGSVTTSKIMNRAVTGDKIFSTNEANRILAVTEPNGNPIYTRLVNEMISNRSVDGRTLFSSNVDNRVLAVTSSGSDPVWTLITHEMISHAAVESNNIKDNSIEGIKLANDSVGYEKLEKKPIIESTMLMDGSVTSAKLADQTIESSKIKDHTVTSKKLDKDLILKGHPTVEPDVDLEVRSIRNVIISPNAPTGGNSGDIWFRYI